MDKTIINYDHHLMSPDVNDEMKVYQYVYLNDVQMGDGMQEGDFFVEYTPGQDGAGLGSFFSGLFRGLRPIGKKLLHAAGKHALNTAMGVASDIAHGDNWRDAIKYRAAQTGDKILDQVNAKVGQMMTGSGMRYTPRMNFTSRITYPDGSYDKRELKRINAASVLLSLQPPSGREGATKKGSSSSRTKRSAPTPKKRKSPGKAGKVEKKKQPKKKLPKSTKPKKRKKNTTTTVAIPQTTSTQEGKGYTSWL